MFVLVPYYLHFVTMDLMVLCGMFKIWDLISDPKLFVSDLSGELLGLHGACLVVLQTQEGEGFISEQVYSF